LAPELAAALDALDPPDALAPACPVRWFEAVSAPGQGLPPAAASITAEWRQRGVDLEVHAVHCPPFWTTSEITVSQAWLATTSNALQMSAHEP